MLKYVTLASPTPQTLPRIFVLFQHAVKRYGINVPTHFQLFSRTKGIAACNFNCFTLLLSAKLSATPMKTDTEKRALMWERKAFDVTGNVIECFSDRL